MAEVNDTVQDLIAQQTDSARPAQSISGATDKISLSLTGQMDMAWENAAFQDRDQTLTMLETEVDRFNQFQTIAPTYYIEVPYNINGHITHYPGTINDENSPTGVSNDTNDDAFGMSEITVSYSAVANNEVADTVRSLPYADATYLAAEFTANDPETHQKVYGVDVNINLTNDGSISANASIRDGGVTFTGVVDDLFGMAQNVGWPKYSDTSAASVDDVIQFDRSQEDTLAAGITGDELFTHFSNTNNNVVGALENDINDMGNIVSSYEIHFNDFAPDVDNNLTQWAKANYVNDTNDPLSEGERIVTVTPKAYEVTVEVAGTAGGAQTYTMVNDFVYGILVQASPAEN